MKKNNNEEKIVELLEELIFWLKESTFPEIKGRLEKTLNSPKEKIAYNLSDGEKTTREIGKIVETANKTISTWWKSWIAEGIAEPIPARGGGNRAKKKFELEKFGIEVPK